MAKPTPVKLVLVGDGAVGKTSMVTRYTSGSFPEEYVPTVADNCSHDISVDDKSIRLAIHDTAGQEEYDRLRPLSYRDTYVFILCYSVNSRDSYRNVSDKWMPELRHYGGIGVPIVLVATKTDLRNNSETIEDLKRYNCSMLTTDDGKRLAKDIGASRFAECSALTADGLDTVFSEAMRAHFAALEDGSKKRTKRPGCDLL